MKSALLIIACLLLSIQNCFSQPKLVWNKNSESNVTGYLVYIGFSSQNYDMVVDVGLDTFMVLSTTETRLRYFAVKAYTADTTSGFSQEITYTTVPTINCDCNRDGLLVYTLDFALLRKFIGVDKFLPNGTINPKWVTNQLDNYDFDKNEKINAVDRGLFQKLCKR